MKKPVPLDRSGQDRWLVSYADLVTLLFAFFTTLYAAQAVDATGAGDPAPQPAAASVTNENTHAESPEDASVDSLRARLNRRLADDVRLLRADIVRDGRGLVVSLPERATFAEGSAEVSAEAKPLIRKVVEELSAAPYELRIEGHTDDTPIQTARFPSNWELSVARAGAVVAYLIDDLHVRPASLSAAGYAEFHPIVPNDSPANRARNRRIDIVVLERPEAGGVEEGQ